MRIGVIMLFFQVVILKKSVENIPQFTLGMVLSVLGLHFFLKGTTMSLIPLGNTVGRNLYLLDNTFFIVLILIFIAPELYVSIAMDSASATTGPVNIPINMALAIGVASVIEGVDPSLSGFGIIGLTSVGAMVSVLILGILTNL